MNTFISILKHFLKYAWNTAPRALFAYGTVLLLRIPRQTHAVTEYLTLLACFFAAHLASALIEHLTLRLFKTSHTTSRTGQLPMTDCSFQATMHERDENPDVTLRHAQTVAEPDLDGDALAIPYTRVLPRDLFNEAKLLKCIGRLCLLIHDHQTPVPMSFADDGDPFSIWQFQDDGGLFVRNLSIRVRDRNIVFSSVYNSKANYPLMARDGNDRYLVFDEHGGFTEAFITWCSENSAFNKNHKHECL